VIVSMLFTGRILVYVDIIAHHCSSVAMKMTDE